MPKAHSAFLVASQAESSLPLLQSQGRFVVDHNNVEQALLQEHALLLGLISPAHVAHNRQHDQRRGAERAETAAEYEHYEDRRHRWGRSGVVYSPPPPRTPAPDHLLIDSVVVPVTYSLRAPPPVKHVLQGATSISSKPVKRSRSRSSSLESVKSTQKKPRSSSLKCVKPAKKKSQR